MVWRAVAGSKLAGTLRVIVLVQTLRNGTATLPGFAMLTRRVAREQRMVSCGMADALRKVAAPPSVPGANVQLPVIGIA